MRKFLIIGGIAVAVILMAFVAKNSGEKPIELRMEKVARGEISKSVMASGYINYRQNVTLRTEVTGQINEILVEEGQRVKAGAPLLYIDPTVFQAAVDQQRALHEMRKISITRQEVLLAILETKLERQRKLFERNIVGKDAFENIERDTDLARVDLKSRRTELEQSKAAYEQALDRLKKTVIRAPIDGIVTGLNAKLGETVVEGRSTMVGSSLMNVSDPSEIIAEIDVEEAGILGIEVGQLAHVTTAADPNGYEKGRVTDIGTTARKVGNNNNSFQVKLHLFDSTPDQVRLGLSCRAEIYTATAQGVLHVPAEAVLYEKDIAKTPYVFIEENGISVKKTVEIGLQNDSRVEIHSGVSENDTLIVGPYRLLKTLSAGKAVKAMEKTEKKSAKNTDDD